MIWIIWCDEENKERRDAFSPVDIMDRANDMITKLMAQLSTVCVCLHKCFFPSSLLSQQVPITLIYLSILLNCNRKIWIHSNEEDAAKFCQSSKCCCRQCSKWSIVVWPHWPCKPSILFITPPLAFPSVALINVSHLSVIHPWCNRYMKGIAFMQMDHQFGGEIVMVETHCHAIGHYVGPH